MIFNHNIFYSFVMVPIQRFESNGCDCSIPIVKCRRRASKRSRKMWQSWQLVDESIPSMSAAASMVVSAVPSSPASDSVALDTASGRNRKTNSSRSVQFRIVVRGGATGGPPARASPFAPSATPPIEFLIPSRLPHHRPTCIAKGENDLKKTRF